MVTVLFDVLLPMVREEAPTCSLAAGCQLAAVLVNTGGPGVGTATLAAADANKNVLASCQAPIPITSHRTGAATTARA